MNMSGSVLFNGTSVHGTVPLEEYPDWTDMTIQNAIDEGMLQVTYPSELQQMII